MGEAVIYDMLRQGIWVAVIISAPVLAAALIAGVTIGLLQALTSVQEMTLTFVPKLAAMLAVYWATMSFMSEAMTTFFSDLILPLIAAS